MPGAPLVLYDGDCDFCRGWSRRLAQWDRAGRLRQLPHQRRHEVPGLPVLGEAELDRAVHLVLPDGRVFAGGRAVLALLPFLPGGTPLAWLARLPGAAAAVDRLYAAVARRRHARTRGEAGCAVR